MLISILELILTGHSFGAGVEYEANAREVLQGTRPVTFPSHIAFDNIIMYAIVRAH